MEKLEKQKHDKLQWILAKPPEKRTSEELVDLAKLLMQNNFLKQFSTNPDFIEMCRYLTLESCSEKQLVFSQGDEGDNFYIILKGRVGVYISKALNKYKNFNYLKEITRLESGQSFGELALIYNSVRAASIIALEKTELIVLNRETFKKYIHSMQTSHLNHIIGFYEHLLLFAKIDKHELIKLASKSLMKKYPSKTYLIRQNEEASCIFFIKGGLVQITRKIKFKKNLKNPSIITSFDEPSEEDIYEGNYVELDLKIGEMGKGQYFADFEVINRKKMQFSVFTLLPTELIMLSEYDFKLQITEEIVEIWIKHMKVYPTDIELRKKYIETQYWDHFQRRVIGNQITVTNFFKRKTKEFDRNYTLKKRNAELRVMFDKEDEKICLENLIKDLENKTNFDEFLPHKAEISQKPMEFDPDDILPSPFSPVSNYKSNLLRNHHSTERKLIIPLKSLPTSYFDEEKEKLSGNSNIFTFYQKNAFREMKKIKQSKIITKSDEILDLEENNGYFKRKNLRKVLPKINKNISHSISGLMNIL